MKFARLKVKTKCEIVMTSIGLIESFNSDSKIVKRGYFDLMSLCDINMQQHVSVLNWKKYIS